MASMVNLNTTGFSGGKIEFATTTISSAVIDNNTRAYTVDVNFTANSATPANTRFYGVRIEFTHDTLSP